MPNARAGRTLAELIVTLAVSGALFALLSIAFIGHDRLVSGSTAIAEMRGQTRQARQILPALLRAATSSDLVAIYDTLADFNQLISSGIVCLTPAATQLLLAPDSTANGQRWGGSLHTPQPGDIAHVFDAGALPGPSDDRWIAAQVSGIGWVTDGCAGSPFLDSIADAGHRARLITLSGWPSATPAQVGSLLHITRRRRAMLYLSSGSHFLGASDFGPAAGRWSIVQPLSGPYSGLRFVAADSNWVALAPGAPPLAAAAVTLSIYGRTAKAVRITGMRPGVRADSLVSHFALRNR